MDLLSHYEELYVDAIGKIEKGDYLTDPWIDSPKDQRFGISLVIRPPEEINDRIWAFLEELKCTEPGQYYYPPTDMHITVLSIISCYQGFNLEGIPVSDYVRLLRRSIEEVNSFGIRFRGITASPSGVMVSGFPENGNLEVLRKRVRTAFRGSGLEQSIDQRYTLRTAHATVLRFRKQLQQKEAFIEGLAKYRDHDFGSFKVGQLELVFNDWYHRKRNSAVLGRFRL